MDTDLDLGHLQTLETMSLPDLFGPKTVVTRGTYNLTWEAIAAGADLVTTERSQISDEYSDSRNRYLAERAYAHRASLNGAALAEAILQGPPAHLPEAQALVNARPGLDRLAEVLAP